MISEITNWVLQVIRSHGVLGVVIGVLLESIIAPIPSPLVMMTAGFVLIEPHLALSAALFKIFFVITIPASIAGVVGNYFVYGVAYYGGKPLVKKFKRFLGFSWHDVVRIQKKFEIHHREDVSLFFLRALPIVPLSIVSAGAGFLEMDWRKFGVFSFLGMIPRNFVLAFVGWKLSEVYIAIADYINNIETMLTITILGLVLFIIVFHKFKIINKIESWVLK